MYFADQNINTRNHISVELVEQYLWQSNYIYIIKCRTVITNVKQRFWKHIYKKTKKKNLRKNWKVANRKLGKLENLGNLGNIIPSFLISRFKISEKNFRDFRDFGGLLVFDLAWPVTWHLKLLTCIWKIYNFYKPIGNIQKYFLTVMIFWERFVNFGG